VGVAFQPRKEVALEPELLNRGWKAAPTGITASFNDIALRVTGYAFRVTGYELCIACSGLQAIKVLGKGHREEVGMRKSQKGKAQGAR